MVLRLSLKMLSTADAAAASRVLKGTERGCVSAVVVFLFFGVFFLYFYYLLF